MTTTPGHTQCDSQNEKSIQQLKKMIQEHIEEWQEN